MAVESISQPSQPLVSRALRWQARTSVVNLRSVNYINDLNKSIASKAAFDAMMERALLSKKYWDELLEKLRKAGGGGSSNDSRFDRIAVSMMLTSFLRGKIVQAMLQNFNLEFLKLTKNFSSQLLGISQSALITSIRKTSYLIFFSVINVVIQAANKSALTVNSYVIAQQLLILVVSFFSQFTKLKDILEDEFRELMRRLDMKQKIRKVKSVVSTFFVELKEELLSALNTLKSYLKYLLPSTSTGNPRTTQ